MNRTTVVGAFAVLAVVAASGTAHAWDAKQSYCFFDGKLTCSSSEKSIVALATGGSVSDAFLGHVYGGPALNLRLLDRIEAANPAISGLHFADGDWDGPMLIVAAGGCRDGDHPKTLNINQIAPVFDNRTHSEIGMNGCRISASQHPDRGGVSSDAMQKANHPEGTVLFGDISSVTYYAVPNRKEALAACQAGTAVCTMKDYKASTVNGTASPVAMASNCGTLTQNRTLIWEKSFANESTWENEYGEKVVLGIESDDFKAGLELAFTQRFGGATTQTTTFREQDAIAVPSEHLAVLYKVPTRQVLSGTAVAKMNDSGLEVDVPWTVSQTMSDGSEGLVWDERPLTDDELKDVSICPLSGGITKHL
ncbi:hypothetical protein ACFYPT_37830 [Streptomyces sp. NPDC005529]|uniref:hypothetical protein n=1 Tax=unclassified Streptomyces TaxID=2593676 RepID=UPI0033BBD04F